MIVIGADTHKCNHMWVLADGQTAEARRISDRCGRRGSIGCSAVRRWSGSPGDPPVGQPNGSVRAAITPLMRNRGSHAPGSSLLPSSDQRRSRATSNRPCRTANHWTSRPCSVCSCGPIGSRPRARSAPHWLFHCTKDASRPSAATSRTTDPGGRVCGLGLGPHRLGILDRCKVRRPVVSGAFPVGQVIHKLGAFHVLEQRPRQPQRELGGRTAQVPKFRCDCSGEGVGLVQELAQVAGTGCSQPSGCRHTCGWSPRRRRRDLRRR